MLQEQNVNEEGINFVSERDSNLKNSPFIEWLKGCSGWTLAQGDALVLNRLGEYFQFYLALLNDTDIYIDDSDIYELEMRFQEVLLRNSALDKTVHQWINQFSRDLGIVDLLQRGGNYGYLLELKSFYEPALSEQYMRNLAFKPNSNSIILTTMHASKGREFEYVVLPGIQSGEMDDNVDERRLFYVACTRASKHVYILGTNSEDKDLSRRVFYSIASSKWMQKMLSRHCGECYSINNQAGWQNHETRIRFFAFRNRFNQHI